MWGQPIHSFSLHCSKPHRAFWVIQGILKQIKKNTHSTKQGVFSAEPCRSCFDFHSNDHLQCCFHPPILFLFVFSLFAIGLLVTQMYTLTCMLVSPIKLFFSFSEFHFLFSLWHCIYGTAASLSPYLSLSLSPGEGLLTWHPLGNRLCFPLQHSDRSIEIRCNFWTAIWYSFSSGPDWTACPEKRDRKINQLSVAENVWWIDWVKMAVCSTITGHTCSLLYTLMSIYCSCCRLDSQAITVWVSRVLVI